jgi:hypothetical protein
MRSNSANGLSFRLGDVRPREIALTTRLGVWLWLTAPTVLLLIFSSGFFSCAFADADPRALRALPSHAIETTGTIVKTKAHTSKRKRSHSRRHTGDSLWVAFEIDGVSHEVVRYTEGLRLQSLPKQLVVKVDKRHPSRAHVEGTEVVPASSLLLALGALVVAAFVFFYGARRAAKKMGLMRNGVLTTARLKRSEIEEKRGRTVHVLTFEFTHATQTHLHVVRTQKTMSLIDEQLEPIVFDEHNPDHAFVLDELDLSPRRDSDGVMVSTKTWPIIVGAAAWFVGAPLALAGVLWPFIANGS